MEKTTLQKIYDEFGHPGFAWFVDAAIKDGHTIANIHERDAGFGFEMDGLIMGFHTWMDAKEQLEHCYKMLGNCRRMLEACEM